MNEGRGFSMKLVVSVAIRNAHEMSQAGLYFFFEWIVFASSD